MSASGPLISLLTDFGLADSYVGVMKGIIWGINPKVLIVDLCHQVPAQDIRAAAFVLETSWSYLPPGTIHVAVVDPGVGTQRRLLAAQAADHYFLGPDNGLFSWIFADYPPTQLVSLENPRYWLPQLSATFHGRDILAPVAGHLSLGVPLTALGPTREEWLQLPRPQPQWEAASVRGEIIYIDHFGNLVTNLKAAALEAWRQGRPIQVELGPHRFPQFSRTYGEVPIGEPLCLIGSHGYLEIAVNQGQAARQLQAGKSDPITIRVVGKP